MITYYLPLFITLKISTYFKKIEQIKYNLIEIYLNKQK